MSFGVDIESIPEQSHKDVPVCVRVCVYVCGKRERGREREIFLYLQHEHPLICDHSN